MLELQRSLCITPSSTKSTFLIKHSAVFKLKLKATAKQATQPLLGKAQKHHFKRVLCCIKQPDSRPRVSRASAHPRVRAIRGALTTCQIAESASRDRKLREPKFRWRRPACLSQLFHLSPGSAATVETGDNTSYMTVRKRSVRNYSQDMLRKASKHIHMVKNTKNTSKPQSKARPECAHYTCNPKRAIPKRCLNNVLGQCCAAEWISWVCWKSKAIAHTKRSVQIKVTWGKGCKRLSTGIVLEVRWRPHRHVWMCAESLLKWRERNSPRNWLIREP